MNCLFAWKYYSSNKKKFIPVFLILIFVVFMLCTLQILSKSLSYSTFISWVKPLENVSIVVPISTEKQLSLKYISEIEGLDSVENVIPLIYKGIYITNNAGGNTDTMLFGVKQEDMNLVMNRLDLKVKEGRLPAKGTNEIALHWRVASNKGLKILDNMGSKVSKNERLEGDYKIVGIIEGEPIVSFTSMEGLIGKNDIDYEEMKKNGIAIIPKKNQLEKLNKYLADLSDHDSKIYSFETGKESYHRAQDVIDLTLNILAVILTIVLSLIVGLISYVFYYQRRSEFGVLYALGFTGKKILKQVIIEIFIMIFSGFVLGIITSAICSIILNQLIFLPKGQPLNIWNVGYIKSNIFIPLSIVLFCFIPTSKMIKKLDPISIIEGGV